MPNGVADHVQIGVEVLAEQGDESLDVFVSKARDDVDVVRRAEDALNRARKGAALRRRAGPR